MANDPVRDGVYAIYVKKHSNHWHWETTVANKDRLVARICELTDQYNEIRISQRFEGMPRER